MILTSRLESDVTIIAVEADRINAASAVHLKDQFRDCISNSNGRVLMDVEQVTFMDLSLIHI